MFPCSRMKVVASGLDRNGNFAMSENGNKTQCTGEVGKCGCKHAEIALLEKMQNPLKVYVSHSPCINCAKSLVEAGVEFVAYIEPYRKQDGIEYLKENNVKIRQVPRW